MTEIDTSLQARAALVGLEVRKRPNGYLLLHNRENGGHDAAYRCDSVDRVESIIARFEAEREARRKPGPRL